MLRICDFRTEYRKEPIGLTTANPRFSWRFGTDTEGFIQESYRVLVASTRENLKKNVGDLWDSDMVISAQQTGIRYEGRQLKTLDRCYVKCIVSGSKMRAESDICSFEMGLLDKSDWKGLWVSVPVNFLGGSLLFRKVLELPKDNRLVRARAFVCGLGYHEVYVNGKKAGSDVLNPGVTDYNKRVLSCAYDITDMLSADTNVFGVIVGNGWMGNRKLLVQLYAEYADGTVFEDHSANCNGWWVAGAPVVGDGVYSGEIYDARMEEKYPGWCTSDFEPGWANGWLYTVLVQPPVGEIENQEIEPIRVTGNFPVKSEKKITARVTTYDFGQNFSGWARIRVTGERGAKVSIFYGEGLLPDGRVNRLNLRSAECRDIYILKSGGEETYEPRFTYHGFRYAEVRTEGEVELLEITGCFVHSDVEPAGSFECSDETLNRLHRNAVITEANNLHSIMTDCPQRDERFGWLNDLTSRIYQSVYNFGMERFFPKVIQDIADTQTPDGAIADTAPFYTGARPADPVCVCYLVMGLMCYRLYGDKEVIRRHYDGFKLWVNYLLTRQTGYIMDYYYYADWVTPAIYNDKMTDGIYVSSAYLYWHLKAMAEIAGILGRGDDRKEYSEYAEASKAAFNAKYYDAATGNYANGTQAANAIALSLGLAPEGDRKTIAENIAREITRVGCHSTCGNQGYRHLFYSMSDEGYMDLLIEMIKNPEYPGWGYMIENGATTVWERWEAEMQNEMHSFNHPMFGSYDAWFYRYLGGIGFKEDTCAARDIIIEPHIPRQLMFVNCSFRSVRGEIVCNWVKKGDIVEYKIVVPPNAVADISLQGRITSINGKDPGNILMRGDRAVFEVGSGEYVINVETLN